MRHVSLLRSAGARVWLTEAGTIGTNALPAQLLPFTKRHKSTIIDELQAEDNPVYGDVRFCHIEHFLWQAQRHVQRDGYQLQDVVSFLAQIDERAWADVEGAWVEFLGKADWICQRVAAERSLLTKEVAGQALHDMIADVLNPALPVEVDKHALA